MVVVHCWTLQIIQSRISMKVINVEVPVAIFIGVSDFDSHQPWRCSHHAPQHPSGGPRCKGATGRREGKEMEALFESMLNPTLGCRWFHTLTQDWRASSSSNCGGWQLLRVFSELGIVGSTPNGVVNQRMPTWTKSGLPGLHLCYIDGCESTHQNVLMKSFFSHVTRPRQSNQMSFTTKSAKSGGYLEDQASWCLNAPFIPRRN